MVQEKKADRSIPWSRAREEIESSSQNERAPAGAPNGSGREDFRLDAPTISLPKGGGALRSIDEKFAVNPSNGTASLSLPLPFTAGRGGNTPAVRLAYDSGTGNGLCGLGWSLDLPSIRRRTDRKLPTYRDDEDVFLVSGSEDLVPACTWHVDRWERDVLQAGPYSVHRYRPRTEGAFSRIERIVHSVHGTWWRVTTRNDFTTLYGLDGASRIVDPTDPTRIFQWLPALAFDALGNCIIYHYKPEDLVGVPDTLTECNRRLGSAPFSNLHLKRIEYGNRVPYFVSDADPYRPAAPTGAFLFEATFDYGDEVPGQAWGVREDPFSSYRSGFEIRTYRLLRRVLMLHCFDEFADGEACLVRSLDLDYAPSQQPSRVTYLKSATQSGFHRLPGGGYSRKSLPPVEFDYEPLRWDHTVRTVDPESVANLPTGAEAGAPFRWMDLYGEGIPGVFSEQAGAWFYKANLGDLDEDHRLRLDRLRMVAPRPSLAGVERGVLRLEELEADGARQMVVQSPELQGYFELDPGTAEWLPFRSFTSVLRIDLDDKNLRRIDLDGDGRADILISEEQAFVWYASDGKRGHQPMQRTAKPSDEERGAAVIFADATQSIYLADMTGDGLSDIVRIRNGEVCYWPNLGYGRFGARVTMDNAPRLDHPDRFNPEHVHLADLSGTGATDLIYLGTGTCRAWLNSSGNAWSEPQTLSSFFPPERPNQVSAIDLLGTGTTCLVWSSPLPAHAGAPMRYIDLMGGKKPHLLTRYRNNMGKEVEFSYKSSTWYYLKDKVAGRPWLGTLPFPVHCVRRVEVRDRVGGSRLLSEYRYRHGYYDRAEREFRGFGVVEQIDSEQFEHWVQGDASNVVEQPLHQPPVLTRTWFHTGAFLDRERILTQLRDEYWDKEMARQGFATAAAAAGESSLPDAHLVAAPDIDPDAVNKLGADEWRQALRACKGMTVRREVFALDAPASGATPADRLRQLSPYVASTHNCLVELVQPAIAGAPAVFVVKESEAVTWHYDRELADPRVEHKLNLRVDPYGEVLDSASVVYGRKLADPDLPAQVRAEQARTWITYRRTDMTNDAVSPAHYRLRRPSQVSEYELVGLNRNGALYQITDFSDPLPSEVASRLLERQRTLFYDDAAQAALPLHVLGFRALLFESYRLACTPEFVADVFGGKVTDEMLVEGKYIHLGDTSWWIRSGRSEYLTGGETAADARARFFAPIGHLDGHGARTAIRYLAGYFLLVREIEDAAQNRTQATDFDLRLLQPRRIIDANDNIAEVLFDELGMVKASARLGKGDQGDDLTGLTGWSTSAEDAAVSAFLAAGTSGALTAQAQALIRNAGTRYLYDLHRFASSDGTLPAVVASVLREQHAAVSATSPVLITFEYSSGLGTVAMSKAQAEPGLAKRPVVLSDDSVTIEDVDTRALDPVQLRWLGSGRDVLNNKGKPVKAYEPYFSITPRFESHRELVESGVSPVTTYDPVGRVVRVDYPDGTILRKDHASWRSALWDRNDTVLESAWYDRRAHRRIDAELIAAGKDPVREAEAATRSAQHAATPETSYFDALGRPILQVQHNGLDPASQPILYRTYSRRDVQGRVIDVTDARGNVAVSYRYDLTGRMVYQHSMDGGSRWQLSDITDQPLRSWDDRGHELTFRYDDPLHRPTATRVAGGDGSVPLDHVVERRFYGEGVADDKARNLRGQVAVRYDTAGEIENRSFDFKGNLTRSARRFAIAYREVPDWSGPSPDARLEAETFSSSAEYDARSRVTERSTPGGSSYRPSYNEAGLLETVSVMQDGATRRYVKGIDYDEQGRRQRIVFGNDVSVTYRYDSATRRLLGMRSRTLGGQTLQDFHYTYDPVGNLTHLEDRCVPTVWFGNHVVTGLGTYRYDPSYRLIEATGREHPGQLAAGAADNWDDQPFLGRYSVSDALAWRNYTQRYAYDEVGNLSQMKHAAPLGGNWTRDYHVSADRNRLLSTQCGATVFTYGHHPAHGYMTAMPHLSVMRTDFRDQLQAVAAQAVASGSPETTWYVYDADGQRVRKVTDRSAVAGADPAKRSERYYLDGVEIHREYGSDDTLESERRTFHVMDDRQRVALIDRHTVATGGPPEPRLVRYQGPDHQGSARLETDEDARVISYEEFHPFGTTAYQAVDKDVVAAAKRYRYTGMERDEESGLEYHGARYYVPWLSRWSAPDPLGSQATGNRYAYVKNNPVNKLDANGMFDEPLHGATTFRLLVAAGFTPTDAARIALADAAKDHDPGDTAGKPVDAVFHTEAVRQGHFDPQHAVSRVQADIAGFGGQGASRPEPAKLETFGRNLHNLEDVGFPDAPGPHTRGTKQLAPEVFAMSAWLGAVGGMLLGVSQASGLSEGARVGLMAVGVGFLFASMVGLSIGISLIGIGHGSYTSEMGETSYWMPPAKRVNDQAYQDPVGNTALLQREYALMKQAAAAYYGGPRNTDDAAAARAIYEVTHADTSARISAVFNASVGTAPDGSAITYMTILPGRSSVTRPGHPSWFNAASGTRGVDGGSFSEATRSRVRMRGEAAPDETFIYDQTQTTWRWGYR